MQFFKFNVADLGIVSTSIAKMQLQLFALGKKKHSINRKTLAHVNDCARFVIDEQLNIKSHLSLQRVSNTRKLFNLGHFSILNFLS
jgi:hypothetical protein